MESKNVRINEKFMIQERILDYNLDDVVVTKPKNEELLLETNNYLENEGEPSQGQSLESSVEPRVEIATPTSGKNMIKNHPSEQIIRSKDKGVMTRSRVNEELCLISQVGHKNADEPCKDDYWKQTMKEELDWILKNETWELVPRPADKNVIGTGYSETI